MSDEGPRSEDFYGFPFEELRELACSAIDNLDKMLKFLCERGHPDPMVLRARWTWSLVLGTLAHDLAESAIRSIDAGDLRVAMLINRSLYEYVNRLRYLGIDDEQLIAKIATFDQGLVDFKERHAKEVGDFQMHVDTFGT